MGVFTKIRSALVRFMAGRNGMDALNHAVLWAYIGLYVLRIIAGAVLRSSLPERLLGALCSVLFLLLLFRMFSRHLTRRREENRRWLAFWGRTRRLGAGARARHADKEHKYFTCKECKAVCRVPAGKGKIVITCPRCGAQIRAKS